MIERMARWLGRLAGEIIWIAHDRPRLERWAQRQGLRNGEGAE